MLKRLLHSVQSHHGAVDPPFLTDRVARYRARIERNGAHLLRGRIPGPEAIMLVSNDYLALAHHPTIIEAQVQALHTHGHGLLRSDVFRHGMSFLRDFELRLARFMEMEDAAVCQSGWCANVGLIQSIANPDTPVYLDMYAHASLWEGTKSAGANARPFKHNDSQSLEKLIKRHGQGVVVVDAIYSTSGSVCPLKEIVEVAERYGCLIVVDESHSLGVIGKHGEGLTAASGLARRIHFCTASLSKTFASRGGVVVGSAANTEYFQYESLPAIFSSGILPHEAAGFLTTLAVIAAENGRREQLRTNADYLRHALSELDYNVDDSQSQIISLVSGSEAQTLLLRDALEARGVFGSVFCWPATAKNHALVRFSINSALSREELDRTIQVCRDIREEVAMYDWASTRKRQLKLFLGDEDTLVLN
ncbi:MAG: quorum-sensing autoinducer CAI-1 synthase [Fidelibacterota bacterium]|nr:MAG: quorum-sensing autoinducer CAI-1 synthase [Candidatus Neomarinimicrobiota bacterium]